MVKPQASLAWQELASDLPNRALGKSGFIISIRLGPGKPQDNLGLEKVGWEQQLLLLYTSLVFLGTISNIFHQRPSSPPPLLSHAWFGSFAFNSSKYCLVKATLSPRSLLPPGIISLAEAYCNWGGSFLSFELRKCQFWANLHLSRPGKLHLSFVLWMNSGARQLQHIPYLVHYILCVCFKGITPVQSASPDCEHISCTWRCYPESVWPCFSFSLFPLWILQVSFLTYAIQGLSTWLTGTNPLAAPLLLKTYGGTPKTGYVWAWGMQG